MVPRPNRPLRASVEALDSGYGNPWHLTLGQLTVRVAGPAGSNETMTATLYPAIGGTTAGPTDSTDDARHR